ncbi:MAG: type III polyketide synthase [Cytophagaceae bacterium]
MARSYISSIGIASPDTRIAQAKVADLMTETLEMEEMESARLSALYRATGIQQRYSVLEDYSKKNGDFDFFPNTAGMEPFPTIGPRMRLYEKFALKLSMKAIADCLNPVDIELKDITHVITVSCTGLYAPGLDIELVEKLRLNTSVQRTCINFMGCYAAFNALKVADWACKADENAKVLIVCVELCSLHFLKNKNPDQLVSNALFGDGAAAVLIEGKKQKKGVSLSMESFYCSLALDGKNDMAWHITDHGFEMTLSSYVPEMIKGGIRNLTDKLLQNLNIRLEAIDYFAIHPGGKRILEAIEDELLIKKEDNRYAYEVLKNYGNMSSPTVLFVLRSILKDLNEKDEGKNILSFAFGPGLTLESMLLKVC